MLSALFYPFSRCIDSGSLKQLLLVFDSVTFLDPVDDDEWRAKLFRDLEKAEDPRFRAYRHLEQPLLELRQEGVIQVRRPDHLRAFTIRETTAGALSDLQDPVWCKLASNPAAFGLPHRTLGENCHPTWQIFAPKFPPDLREVLESEAQLRKHLIWRGDEYQSWTVSYEAGSAASLNLHLAAADELSLAPVTDSIMHHRLLIRKLARSLTPESEWVQPQSQTLDAVAHRTALQLVEHLLPKAALVSASFDSILRFRSETKQARGAMVQQLKRQLVGVASLSSLADITAAQSLATEALVAEVREYQASLVATRDKVWPGAVKAATGAVTSGTAAAVALQVLVGGPFAVLAGSIAGASLSLLSSALEQRAETNRIKRAASPAVAYLSQLTQLRTTA